MGRLKATQKGKAGKHKGQDTVASVYVRSLRKARVITATDRRLLARIVEGSGGEQEGALAGSKHTKLAARF
ncbi:hypothetical protein [Pseudomonas sp.]|jgi:hypothetical protein|uniref:hypothetical protein n=1 Tax=Pseudomonas sp. TaxID=306 RepID=UPI002EDBA481